MSEVKDAIWACIKLILVLSAILLIDNMLTDIYRKAFPEVYQVKVLHYLVARDGETTFLGSNIVWPDGTIDEVVGKP
ncbi:MAG: hypothetical protein WC340_15650 [Kiritimatiellia bacterium]